MGKLAFVFPGQGSQEVGMLSDVADSALVSDTFAEASAALGYDLWALVQNGPADQLNQTEFTQPALLTASIALWRLAQDAGIPAPEVVAGHSLGEYSALVAAGVLDFATAATLVQKRGQFMQTAVPLGEGGMVAVLGLDDDKVTEICIEHSSGDQLVQAVNFNAPGQVVIAGQNTALEAATAACKAAGAKRAMPLSASAPFHSALMKPAADKMAEELAKVAFSVPAISVIQNVDAEYCDDPDQIRRNLVTQMYSAVLWTDTVQKMAATGVDRVAECGPGKVLAGLNKRIEKSLVSFSVNSAEGITKTREELN
ncbi:MAG: ACP S-malonyltransferase [Pseudomonadales bacterium]|nr:ACP S-malonyltransferase [Pseudomonadales bacterium]